MTPRTIFLSLCLIVGLAACNPDHTAAVPAPREPRADDIGTICHMGVTEHRGPKGQVYLKGQTSPLWFSSVRDAFTWLLVDEGLGQAVAAVYFNDMGRAASWDDPGPGTWVEARQAVFVAGSDKGAAMGGQELAPFADRLAASRFVAEHGGRILAFKDVDRTLLVATAGESPALPQTNLSDGVRKHDQSGP